MSAKIALDKANYDFAKRFITAYFALRSHITTQSIINYPPGLSPNQLKMLHLVFHKPGISQTLVAERLGVTTASISTSVREMEAQGLIERRPNPDDARVLLLHLAPLGEQIFEQVFDQFINTCADLLGVLPCDDQQQLVERFEAVLVANNINLDVGKMSYSEKLRMMKDSPNPVT
ncbi:MAG: MarR family transcriptional regulator [Chloroflexota bacterium]